MKLPDNLFSRKKRDRSSGFTTTFRLFRRLLGLNNAVLEKIGTMESALAGEYVFDRKFLSEAVTELNELVREVVSCLAGLTGNHYPILFDRYEEIAGKLSGLAFTYAGPYDRSLTLDYHLLNSDFEELVGGKNATLSEIRNRLYLNTPDGFAITVAAYFLFMESTGIFSSIDALCEKPGTSREREEQIAGLIAETDFPEPLVAAVSEALARLLGRAGGPVPLAVRSSGFGEDRAGRSFAGQFDSVLQVKPEAAAVLAAYRQVIASRFSAAALEYLGEKADSRSIPMAVGVQPMIAAPVAGVTYSRDPEFPDKNQLVVTALRGTAHDLVSGRRPADRFILNRTWPFLPLTSELLVTDSAALPLALAPLSTGALRRGSATLVPAELAKLAEQALLLEKTFGEPQDIEWAWDGAPVILQSRPLALPVKPPPPPGELADELAAATQIFTDRGQVAQLGIAAGRVVYVDQSTDPALFPVGAIAVARFPSPALSPIVWRAAAIITEVGGPTGHLATIAREYRTPALFGVGEAIRLLAEGAEVTLDVENKRAYEGIIEGLVRHHQARAQADDYLAAKELRILRRILRWVAPLTLADPSSDEFTAENCRTFHDILRFAHEKAIDTLINFHTGEQDDQTTLSRPVRLPVPLRLRIIDLGNGLKPGAPETGELSLEMLNSKPLAALFTGFLKNDQEGGRELSMPDLRDLLSGMTNPMALFAGPSYPGDNLGIIAESYMNICLRLGYHLNVVDAYMSPDPDSNSIYFRFAGGMAEKAKREWRARLIGEILAGLYFKVELKGDLVIGKARNLDLTRMERVLIRLGELISFTRQLDVRMRDEAAIGEFFERFLAGIRQEQVSA